MKSGMLAADAAYAALADESVADGVAADEATAGKMLTAYPEA
ncbi:hypothetical protein JCM17846_09200 [Iodidimonas nitroreducens]|uniref:Uncharacterized protein n=1 Tax=Iodidimonas nitroreducens TaxID=1236968 RepID=A0A5A7N537_9PROT|nr:hypothetical protein JCM17846_09200 [Iodidimonas nitroreducens]